MAKLATVRLEVRGVPELIWQCRHAMANLLREEAEGEPEFVARRLREIAAAFEVGQGEMGDGDVG